MQQRTNWEADTQNFYHDLKVHNGMFGTPDVVLPINDIQSVL